MMESINGNNKYLGKVEGISKVFDDHQINGVLLDLASNSENRAIREYSTIALVKQYYEYDYRLAFLMKKLSAEEESNKVIRVVLNSIFKKMYYERNLQKKEAVPEVLIERISKLKTHQSKSIQRLASKIIGINEGIVAVW